ncbi:putative sulfate transporterc [mine drainage metagenome]|uniref:Putative sulfate transporterc n=1 Tax=mine drainage metagenome TaxID=410659 RepID=A0A1J5SF44_9ZZZZ
MQDTSDPSDGLGAMSARMFKVSFPFVAELRGYNLTKLRHDLVAGATLTLVSVPQSIGFALILGLPPMAVIMAVVVGGFVSALFFSSHHHVFGPTTSVCLIAAATIASNLNLGLHPLALAAYLAVMIGITQSLAGLLNFGEVTKFISRSVVIAYTAGVGVQLITAQAHNLLGFHEAAGESFLTACDRLWRAVHTGGISLWAVGIGLLTLAIFELLQKFFPKLPEALIGLSILGIAAKIAVVFHPAVPFLMVKDEGALTAALPSFAGLPAWHLQLTVLPKLASTAVAIAIIGMLEATAITKTLAAKSGQHLDPNQELLGMGVGNLACGLFGLPPASSSFARSAVNYQSGAASQLSSMLSSVWVLLILFFVTPVFNFIPIAALAAHLMRVGYKLINREQIRFACRSTRSDMVVFAVTFASALLFGLASAIYIGIGVALALFLQKSSTPTLAEYTFNEAGNLAELTDTSKRANPQISIIHVEGELFFGAADLFQDQVRKQAEDENIRIFILRMKNARHLDASTVMALEFLHEYLRKTDRYLIISGCNAEVTRVLRNSGLYSKIGEENIFPAETNPTVATRRALKRATQILGQKAIDVRIFYDRARLPVDQAAPAEQEPADSYEI